MILFLWTTSSLSISRSIRLVLLAGSGGRAVLDSDLTSRAPVAKTTDRLCLLEAGFRFALWPCLRAPALPVSRHSSKRLTASPLLTMLASTLRRALRPASQTGARFLGTRAVGSVDLNSEFNSRDNYFET